MNFLRFGLFSFNLNGKDLFLNTKLAMQNEQNFDLVKLDKKTLSNDYFRLNV